MSQSAEFLRGWLNGLREQARECTVVMGGDLPHVTQMSIVERADEIRALLAAAEAREAARPQIEWNDEDVQAVYQILGSDEFPGAPDEHWEGKVARSVGAYCRSREAGQPTAAEVIAEAKVAFDQILFGHDSMTLIECEAKWMLARIAAWEAAKNG